jgi:L-ascorbate metabolism protein UlaG (beta-lactamase superfamily)
MYKTSILTIIFILTIIGCSNKKINKEYISDHYKDGVFINPELENIKKEKKGFLFFIKMMWNKPDNTKPSSKIPVINLTKKDLINLENNSVIRLGHSTILLKIDNRFILTDPMFSKRASPVFFIGPKKFHKNPIEIEELPFIDIVIISHNHYDHLDKSSIKKLKSKVGMFYTTLGLKEKLMDFGVDANKIVELDWWDKITNQSIKIIATPSQHFSARTLFDRNKTLWASWVIKSKDVSIFFGSDGGYFSGFKKIGEKFGPFDMAFLEVGAYNTKWKNMHMMPEKSVQTNIDLKSKIMFPIHNGSFELSNHSWKEPFERVDKEALKKNINIMYPKMGEAISLLYYQKTAKWWETLE